MEALRSHHQSATSTIEWKDHSSQLIHSQTALTMHYMEPAISMLGAICSPLIRPKIRRDPFKHLSTEAARRPATPRRNSHQDNGRNARLRIERPNNPSSKPPVVQVDRTANQRNNMGLNREKPREVVPIRGNFSLKPQQVRAERSINSQRNKALIQSKEKSKPIER